MTTDVMVLIGVIANMAIAAVQVRCRNWALATLHVLLFFFLMWTFLIRIVGER